MSDVKLNEERGKSLNRWNIYEVRLVEERNISEFMTYDWYTTRKRRISECMKYVWYENKEGFYLQGFNNLDVWLQGEGHCAKFD